LQDKEMLTANLFVLGKTIKKPKDLTPTYLAVFCFFLLRVCATSAASKDFINTPATTGSLSSRIPRVKKHVVAALFVAAVALIVDAAAEAAAGRVPFLGRQIPPDSSIFFGIRDFSRKRE
jgi:hypothetical protein